MWDSYKPYKIGYKTLDEMQDELGRLNMLSLKIESKISALDVLDNPKDYGDYHLYSEARDNIYSRLDPLNDTKNMLENLN